MTEQLMTENLWTTTQNGYGLAITEGKIVARNQAGKELKAVPPSVKKDPAYEELTQLLDWLISHEKQAFTQINEWLIRSLPVPARQVISCWADPAWSYPLTDLVIRVGNKTGFLRGVNVEDNTLGVVNLDGETEWLSHDYLSIPHPVLLGDELADYQEFAIELGVEQRLPQLLRESYTIGERDPKTTEINDFSGGVYEQLRYLAGRAASNGYKVQGGYSTVQIWENGQRVEARMWIGIDDPESETATGSLVWVKDSLTIPLAEVGPVAFSEGMRMAAILYAGRKTENGEEN